MSVTDIPIYKPHVPIPTDLLGLYLLSAITHHLSHLSLDRQGRWGTKDDFATSFLHFSLFSTAPWDLANSEPVHSLMLFVFPSLRLSALFSSPFHCALQDGFGQT